VLLASIVGLAMLIAAPAQASDLPAGFQETTAFNGLVNPTQVEFSPDGRVFVAEKSGLIKVFDGFSDTTPTTFADLRTQVHNFWDRGLLGMALDPNFPASPYVYVLYTHDAAIGGTAPRWGTAGASSDPCPTPPGPTTDGCVVSGRLSRLTASGNSMVGGENVLIEDWCQQFPSHSVGDIQFGADGALYASGGEGASFYFADYGQAGSPKNPCGDPPTGVGGTQTPPTAEGGALRSQDAHTPGDPTGLNGSVIRVDRATGQALPGNPWSSSTDPNRRKIVGLGLRNPFRFTIRPGTNELWIGDVGWNDWEEIDLLENPTDSQADNFGWPCWEGFGHQDAFTAANLDLCNALQTYDSWMVEGPYYGYHHQYVLPDRDCPYGSSSISGLDFYPQNGPYPQDYRGGLFFADYSRDCIWIMPTAGGTLPNYNYIRTFAVAAANPVDVEIGPDGNVYYADFDGGTIRKIAYASQNQPPVAVADASPTSGAAPLNVQFDGTRSSDADGDALSYAWDLDGDGQYDDSTAARPSNTYNQEGVYTVSLRVTDTHGATSTATVTISVGNTPPTATIIKPTAATQWQVGELIGFAGSASDAQDGPLPASAMKWSLDIQHCPSNCHTHHITDWPGISAGSFTAPDHEYPSYLTLSLQVTDSGGLKDTKSVRLDPRTVTLTLDSNPNGLNLVLNAGSAKAPFTRTVIMGSNTSISAPSPQTKNNGTLIFKSWSDGGAQTHNITANATKTYTATFKRR